MKDIRQDALYIVKRGLKNKLLLSLFIALAGGIVVAFVGKTHNGLFGWITGLIAGVLTLRLLIRAVKEYIRKRKMVLHGILMDAEVVDVVEHRKKPDEKLFPCTVTCSYSTSAGKKYNFTMEISSMDTIAMPDFAKKGSKFPIFVNPSDPGEYLMEKGLPVRIALQTPDDLPNEYKKMMKNNKSPKEKRKDAWGCFVMIIFALGISYMVFRACTDTFHDPIPLSDGWYITSLQTTTLSSYDPATDTWVYLNEEGGTSETDSWQYDSRCRKPVIIIYARKMGREKSTEAGPRLLVPEKYHERLGEFIDLP